MKALAKGYILILVILNAGCALPRFPEIYDIKNFEITSQNDSQATALVDVVIYNPNIFGFKLKSLDYTAYINDIYIGRGFIDREVAFKPESFTSIDSSQVTVCYKDLDKALLSLPVLDSIPVRFKLKARFENVLFPVYWVKTVNVDTRDLLGSLINWNNVALFLGVPKVSVKNINLRSSLIELAFTFKNPYPVGLTIDTAKIEVYDRFGNKIGDSRIENIPIRPKSKTPLVFPLRIDNVMFAISLLGQYMDEKISFRVKGYLIVRIKNSVFRLPVDQAVESEIQLE